MLVVTALVAATLGCHPHATPHHPPERVAVVDYAAIRWVPARPTYAVVARSVREAQRAFADGIGPAGIVLDVDAVGIGQALARVLGVDPLDPDALTRIGVDVDGGIAVFSEGFDPTLVVHLNHASLLGDFLTNRREHGMQTVQTRVDGVEVFATESNNVALQWAVDDDWLWVHFDLAGGSRGRGTSWFTSSRHAGAPAWDAAWRRASARTPRIAGFVDPRGLLRAMPWLSAVAACTQVLAPVGEVAFSIETDGTRSTMRFDLDLGASAAGLARAVHPPPSSWDQAASAAPLSGAWNLDIPTVEHALAPCARALGEDPAPFDRYGVRAARALLATFDPGEPMGTGVVALDLSSTQFVKSMLDRIPLRTRIESSKRFGPYAGHSLSIPFGPTVEYVLTDSLALGAVGEGMLARVVSGRPGTGAPQVFAFDAHPPALSREAWAWLFDAAGLPMSGVDRLQRWRALHAGASLDGTRLVIEVTGER